MLFALTDTVNGRLISRHRLLRTAATAAARYDRHMRARGAAHRARLGLEDLGQKVHPSHVTMTAWFATYRAACEAVREESTGLAD